MSDSNDASSLDWIHSILKRFKNLLPQGDTNDVLLNQTSKSLVELSTIQFQTVLCGLLDILTELPCGLPPEASQVPAVAAVLHCTSRCLAKKHTLKSPEIDVIEKISHSSCMLALLSESDHGEISCEAQRIIHHISRIHFHCIYNKIVGKLSGTLMDSLSTQEDCSLVLIQYMDLNLQRLNQVLAAFVATHKDLKKNKNQLTAVIAPVIHQAVWNFVTTYPEEFNNLINEKQSHLATHAEKLFDILDGIADSTKKKVQLWPLMNVLLILCPKVLMEIAQNTDKEESRHKSKRSFLTAIEKAITAPGSFSSSNKVLVEIAVVCGVELTKACTYINDHNNTIFRYYVTLLQNSLQDLLFSPSNIFLHLASSQSAGVPTYSDQFLMVDCFVALYRINHRNNHLANVCMAENAPAVFHIVLARSLYTLLTQNSVLSWWPEKETVYSLAPTLRRLFQEYLNIVRRHDRTAFSSQDIRAFNKDSGSCATLLSSKTRTERKALVELVMDCQVLTWVVRCFYADPVLAFTYTNVDGQHLQSLQMMTGLATLVQDPSTPLLAHTAAQTLLHLHEPKYIELWDTDDTMVAFWDISCQIAFSFTMKLISHKATDVSQMLNWLKQILDYQQQYLQLHKESALIGTSCKIFLQTQNRLEMALLTYLRNTNLHNVQISLTCFQFLVQLAEVLITTGEPCPLPFADNIKPYQALADASKNLLIGRAAQQKTICNILKDVVYTPGSSMGGTYQLEIISAFSEMGLEDETKLRRDLAWEDTLSSWKSLTTILKSYEHDESPPPQPDVLKFGAEVVMRSRRGGTSSKSFSSRPQAPEMTDEDLQHIIIEWTNMSGFLCALGGVATGGRGSARPMSLVPSASSVESLNTLNLNSGSIARSSSFSSNEHLHSIGNRSRFRLSVNMGSSSLTAPLMAEEPNTSNCAVFIDELVSLLNCDNERMGVKVRETAKEVLSYGLSPALYPHFFQKVDSILQPKEKIQTSEQQTTLIDQITMIIQHILELRSETATIAMVNVKMDLVISKLMYYADQLPFCQQSISIKIKLCQLLQTLMDCRTDLSYHHQMRFRNEAVDKLTEWLTSRQQAKDKRTSLDMSQSPQLTSLSQDLDIASMKAVALLLDGLPLQPPESSERSTSDEKGKLFFKYFSLFMELIREHFGGHTTLASPESIQQQQQQRNVFSLKQYTISAMSNMLMANIESGLSHAVNLGYHEEVLLRTTFMDVLSSVFKQGVEFGSLAENHLANRYSQLVEFVTTITEDGDMPIITLFSEAIHPNNMDELARVLVIMFDSNHKLTAFLMKVFQMEVYGVVNYRSDALFRGNSLSCKVLSQCFKIFGIYYLQAELRPLIQQMLQYNKDRDFEVDPVKLSSDEQLLTNQKNLLQLVQAFLDAIINSLPGIPLQLRTVCHCLYTAVANSFPDTALDTVNSAFFLRFISPAIVSPEIYGIVTGDRAPSPRTQRSLMLLSKILQNLANHVVFKKEKHMLVFNDFLKENFERSRKFVTKIASMGPYEEGEAIDSISFMKESDKYSLHQILWDNEDHLSNAIIAMRSVSFHDKAWYQPVQKLETILAQLGSPYQHTRKVSMGLMRRNTINSTQLEIFLESMATEVDDQVVKKARKVFYHGGTSKAGNPVFFCVLRKLFPDQSNKVLFYVISLLRKFTERSFELVLDLTMSTGSNDPELELLINFAVLVPELKMCQLETIYLYNCNRNFKKFASQLAYRIFSHMKGAKKVVPAESTTRLSQYIEESQMLLPKSSVAFENEKDVKIFSPCQLLSSDDGGSKYYVRMKISLYGIVLLYSERMQVFGVSMHIKDIYHVETVKEAHIVDNEPMKLTIRLMDGHTVTLVCEEAKTILQQIYLITSKWQSQQPYMQLSERKLQPKDVPGTLLNIALFNLCGYDIVQRTAAYQLLCAVKESFKLLPDSKLLSNAQGLHIPANNTLFVEEISSKLAQKEKHLTLEFLSEAVTSLQKNDTVHKQYVLLYIKPWLFNLDKFCSVGEDREKKKIHNILAVFIQLGISSAELFPTLQAGIWQSIATVPSILQFVLEYFFKASYNAGLSSVKAEMLTETTVTLASVNCQQVADTTINTMLKLLEETSKEPTLVLNNHYLWSQIAILSRFIHRLTFHNKIDVLSTLPELCYITTMLMSQGDTFSRTTMHGIVINILHSLTLLPELAHSDKLVKILSLKILELELPKWYLQFGIQQVKSSAAISFPSSNSDSYHHNRHASTSDKDSVNVHSLMAITELFSEVMETCAEYLEMDVSWVERWNQLTMKSALMYNPSLQSRSFLALGYITKTIPDSILAKILSILGKAINSENSIMLVEAILRCLIKLVHLLDKSSIFLKHLFWISVVVMQVQEPVTYVSAQLLMHECVKLLDSNQSFLKESLSQVVQKVREDHSDRLKLLDHEIGVSFSTSFNFALSTLLYRGFHHPHSATRLQTMRLFCFLYSSHTSNEERHVSAINENNLAYLTVMFIHSERIRSELFSWELSQEAGLIHDDRFSSLLNREAIKDTESQMLFLLTIASALVHMQDNHDIKLLYQFLSKASTIYCEVYPLIHQVLVPHIALTLSQSQDHNTLSAVHKLIETFVKQSHEKNNHHLSTSYAADIGFSGMTGLFGPFTVYASSTTAGKTEPTLAQNYIDSVIEDHLPTDDEVFAPANLNLKQRRSVGRIYSSPTIYKSPCTFPRSRSIAESGSY